MKKNILFLFFMIFVMFGFAQGILQNPKPTNNNLSSVYFIDATTGYMVGELGTIVKTTDGGITWTSLISGTTKWINTVFFVNSNTGFVAGSGGTILKTSNGGISWTLLNSGTSNELKTIHFFDENTGYVAGEFDLLKTVNGGNTWEKVSGGMKSMCFITKDKIFELVPDEFDLYEYVMKTINGGSTWVQIASSSGYHINGIFFIDAATGYHVGDNGRIFKTTNGGMSWTQLVSGSTDNLYLPFFVDNNVGYVLPNLKTTDGGLHWQKFTAPSLGSEINSIFFTNNNIGYIAGNNYPYGALSMKTSDGGSTWIDLSNHLTQDLYSLHFPSKSVGYAVGDAGTILKTENGGASWNKLTINATEKFNSVWFTNDSKGFAVNGIGYVYSTTDGGASWISKKLNSQSNSLTSIYFPTQDVGFVVGAANSIYKTIDAGAHWVDISINNNYKLESVFFKDSNTGFAVGNDYYDGSMIMKTTDGGTTWDYVWTSNDISNQFNLRYIHFINDNNGYVFTGRESSWYGSQVGLLKTSDGGSTWQFFDIGYGAYLGDAFFTDVNTGYFVSEYGGYYKTTDGGMNWASLPSGTSKDFNKIFFVDENTGYAVGMSGTIVKLKGGSGLGIEEGNLQSSNFELLPNPAKYVLSITDKRRIIEDAKVSIFNMCGENLFLGQFKYQIKINVDNFKKGLYLVKIQSKDYFETKKLVVQ